MRRIVVVLAAALLAVACSEAAAPADEATYVVEVSGEQFKIRVQGADRIADIEARRASGQEGVIIGSLVRGNGGFNSPWGWHLEPGTVEAVDMAIELCDGRPSMVQDDVTYWVDTVKAFCPWGAKIVAKVN